MKKREFLALGGAVPLILAGCGSSGAGTAQIRLLNASIGYSTLDLTVTDVAVTTGVAFGTVSAYTGVSGGSVSTILVDNSGSSSTNLITQTRTLSKDTKYTVVAFGFSGTPKTVQIAETQTAPTTGFAGLSVLNTSVDMGTVDVYLTATSDISAATPVARGVVGVSQTIYNPVGAGTYVVTITGTGKGASDVRLVAPGLALVDQQIATLIIVPGLGGVLGQALLMTNGSDTIVPFSATTARMRVVAGIGDGTGVVALVNGVALSSLSTSPEIGSYALMASGGAPPVIQVNGVTVPVTSDTLPLPLLLSGGADYTILVYGADSSSPVAKLILDDNRRPLISTNIKVRLVHLVNNNLGDLTLQVNGNPVATNVPFGTASVYVETPALATSTILLTQSLATVQSEILTTAANTLYSMYVFQTPNPTNITPYPAPTANFWQDRPV